MSDLVTIKNIEDKIKKGLKPVKTKDKALIGFSMPENKK